jgi:hypothetical protein
VASWSLRRGTLETHPHTWWVIVMTRRRPEAWIQDRLNAIDRLQQRHDVLGFPIGVIRKFSDDLGGKHAALLAHYGFVSLFPLLLVFVTVIGRVLENDPALRQRVIDTAIAQCPVLGTEIERNLSALRGSGLGLAVGLLGTLWGGLGITQTAQDAMNAVWNVPRRDRPNLWLRMARSLGVLLMVAVGIVAATTFAGLGATWPGVLGRITPLVGSLLLNVALLAVVLQILTAPRVPWVTAPARHRPRGARVERPAGARRPDRQPTALAREPGVRGVRGGPRPAVVDVPERPAADVRPEVNVVSSPAGCGPAACCSRP